ncbi:polyphosphate kinase 2 [Asticcacaulis sp. AC402]|uniref:polyphosphate kinase 2 n=1 Tax=Asticcacaulis sp. AC402 TaxID=1282361 RepID=UPI0003C3C640|nr:polyphosphate kinase 2 [Asticcacaulis sp. AC402]ESQ73828.1 polyphosphate kinase [Asticcacaulis sp. AC402]
MSVWSDEEALARQEKLQIALVDTQIWSMKTGHKVCILFEGRDAAGKDGAIKRITEVLSVRKTRVIALPKPTEFDRGAWWFQRYVGQLPTAGDWVLFNRSWYNRAGVERVMGFSRPEEQETFIHDVPAFESMLVRSGITLIKLWLDISRDEQKERLDARRSDPLKRLKVSELDAVAQEKWGDYSQARDDMLKRSHHEHGPWTCVATDSKKKARENILRHVITELACPELSAKVAAPDPDVVFSYDAVIEGRRTLEK